MAHKVVGMGIESIHALLIELSSLETRAAWTIQGSSEIGSIPAEESTHQFPGLITIISRIALAPADDLLAQCRSPQNWVFGWRVDEMRVIVAEVNFRHQRSDISESDLAALRLLGDTSLREILATQDASSPLVEESARPDHAAEPAPIVSLAIDQRQHSSEQSAPVPAETSVVESPPPSSDEIPEVAHHFQPVASVKAVPSFVPSERRTSGFARSTRKTIAVPVGYRPEPGGDDAQPIKEQPLGEADTLIGLPDGDPHVSDKSKTFVNDTPPMAHGAPIDDAPPPLLPDRDSEFPRAYSETVAWPQTPPVARRRPPIVSALGLALAIVCTLLSLWVSTVAVPETMASYQADAQRRRTMSDQTMIRDLSMAMASGDYGDVQTALSSFASMGYFESALVSNTRNRVVAQAGSDTGIRIGDETPPDVKKFARIINLSLASEPLGQLVLLHEENIEEQQQSGLLTLQIGAIVVGVVSFFITLLIALRLYRAPLARLLLRNR